MNSKTKQGVFNKSYGVMIGTVPLPESSVARINLVMKHVSPVIDQIMTDVMSVAIGTWPTPEKPFLGKQIAHDLAKHILEDRSGADYYQDTTLLAEYLQNSLNLSETWAAETATNINQDRTGANYYADQEILQQYLAGASTGGKHNGFSKQYTVMIDTVPVADKPIDNINLLAESISPVINQIITDAMTVAIGTWPVPEIPVQENISN